MKKYTGLFSIEVDQGQINQIVERTNKDGVSRVISSALNGAKVGIVAEWARHIGKEIALPIGKIKEELRVSFSGNSLVVEVRSKPGIPLKEFAPRQNRVGTSVHVKRSSGRVVIPHAFMYQSHVFVRRSRKRTPIDLLYSTDVEDVAKNTVPIMEDFAKQRLQHEVVRAVRFYLG